MTILDAFYHVSNDLKFSEKVLLVELHKLFKNYEQWIIFAHVVLFQRAIIGTFGREVSFLPIFLQFLPPNFNKNYVKIVWHFQRTYFWMSFVKYLRITFLWHSSRETLFFWFFPQFLSQIYPPESDDKAKNSGQFSCRFQKSNWFWSRGYPNSNF